MPARAITKNESRVSFRVKSRHKRLIEQAATCKGLTLTDFAISVLVDRSEQILQERTVRELSARDSEIFLRVLDRAEAPNAALRKAARKYRKRDRLAN